jgi:hypothetical protein
VERILYHVTPTSNVRSIKKRGLVPRLVKRGVYADGSFSKRVYFFVDRDTAEDALMNWIVDVFPRTRYFAVLGIALPSHYEVYEDPEISGALYGSRQVPPLFIRSVEIVDAGA